MSFQSLLDTVYSRTGLTPSDFRRIAASKGFTEGVALKPGVTARQITTWLKQDFNLGRDHAMAIFAILGGTSLPGRH